MDWDFVSSKMAEASENFDEAGLKQNIEMLDDDFDEMERDGRVTEDMIVYVKRVLARSKNFQLDMPVNYASCDYIQNSGSIGNYNYRMYKWAIARGFGDRIDNMFLRFRPSELSATELKSLTARIKQNK